MSGRLRPFLAAVAAVASTSCSTPAPSPPLPEVSELPAQTAVYYNARIALRQGRPKDVLQLWLVRNALESQGEAPLHDGDFRSAVWAALSSAGLCHDGLRPDDDREGVGLWPLALHNWLTRSSSKQPAPEQPRTFTSFPSGFQQRQISLHDVLSLEELQGVRFARGNCLRPYFTLLELGTPHWLDLRDRLSTGIMMRDLLLRSRLTLDRERIRGAVVIETRLFDLDVALAKLARAKARRETGLVAQLAKATGVSESAMTLQREKRLAEVRRSQYMGLLRRCVTWSVEDWLSLSSDRAIALFRESNENYRADADMRVRLDETLLRNIDGLIENEDGKVLSQWLGFAHAEAAGDNVALLAAITEGDRGERLLSLGPATGFRERSVVALRRGTAFLSRGLPMDAMRSFALAMKHADESRHGRDVHNLAKRWFAYVLAQHEASDAVLALLKEFVTPVDRNQLLEVLVWRSAFHGDLASFERIVRGVKRGGSLDVRVRLLRHLAEGDAGAMWRAVRAEYPDQANAIYRFASVLVEELATESLDVRTRNRSTFELGKKLLDEAAESANPSLRRRIGELEERVQTLLDGIAVYDSSPVGRARSAAPGAEAYAGSVRLAPADPLPWPFPVPRVEAPSPFTPIELTPVEWIDARGEQVFGWHIHERWDRTR